jgi:hypothetical protein
LCLNCTDVCSATLGVTTRQAAYDAKRHQAAAARVRGHLQELRDECERHSRHYQHYRVRAEACWRCERACRNLLAATK